VSRIYTDLYIAWNVPRTSRLSELQASLCREFGATPRPELHVTLGHIGVCTAEQLETLVGKLAVAPQDLRAHDFAVAGLGGAYRRNGQTRVAHAGDMPALEDEAVVLWLSLIVEPFAMRLHMRLLEVVTFLGFADHLVTDRFYPHVTIGSRIRSSPTSVWDDYSVSKDVVFRSVPLTHVGWDKLHVVNGNTSILRIAILQSRD
jgi:2'-5' RNA ligase